MFQAIYTHYFINLHNKVMRQFESVITFFLAMDNSKSVQNCPKKWIEKQGLDTIFKEFFMHFGTNDWFASF